MKKIYLYGVLAESFGPGPHEYVAESPVEAASALAANFPTFREVCGPLNLQIIAGDRETGVTLGRDDMYLAYSCCILVGRPEITDLFLPAAR